MVGFTPPLIHAFGAEAQGQTRRALTRCPLRLPLPRLLSRVVDLIYNFLSANRISLGGAMDAIIAAKRVDMSKKGVQTCQGG